MRQRAPRKGGTGVSWIARAVGLSLALALACASDTPVEPEPILAGALLRARTVEAAIPSQPGIPPKRVVLISISGLRPEYYGAGSLSSVPSSKPVMPALGALAAAGAYTDGMMPAMPAAPYPAHATLVTGRVPARHGVLGSEVLKADGLSAEGMPDARRIQGRTLWRAARENGIAVTALGWPSTMGANVELLLPDMGVPSGPETWYERARGRATPWIYEQLTLFDESLPEVLWPTPSAYDSIVTKAACQIVTQPRTPGLWLLYYGQGASALALYGETPLGLDGMRRVDAEIEKLFECFAGAGMIGTTAFLMTGDRSFQPVHSIARPNVALADVGLLTRGAAHLTNPVSEWQAFARAYGGSAIVYAKNERAARLARSALSAQADDTGAYRVVAATELADLSADPEGWFGLEARPGFVLVNEVRGASVEATDFRGGGGYLPTTQGSSVGFVGWGAGVRGPVRLPRMLQVDVGPTAAALLGVSLAGADGRPQVGILGRTPERSTSPLQ